MAYGQNYNFSSTLFISNNDVFRRGIEAGSINSTNVSLDPSKPGITGDSDYNTYDIMDDLGTSAMEEVLKATVNGLNTYAVPIICVLGIVGDVTSFLVFVISSFRYHPCSQYLAALAFVDTMFLLSQVRHSSLFYLSVENYVLIVT
ncbi:FMRFamide receptor [Plakobranchus ocellatus]|uniref:FMRFamide receptor n=1 Tax=Plakobranchus ocellatus TaxID=259542 RepID=A0AAV3Y408_9GAST|nr:FMRFamide receptor [Plakobranchus ocellatus]